MIIFFSCNENSQRDEKKLGEDSLSIKNEEEKKIDSKISKTTTLIDTIINNYKIRFSYCNPFKYLTDSFDFKGILRFETNDTIFEDTIIVETTAIESGLQKIMVVDESTSSSDDKLFAKENLIFLSLAFYPGQILYIFEIKGQRLNLLKAGAEENPIYSDNGFIINGKSLKILALYASRGTRDYNALLYKITTKNSIIKIKQIKIPDLDYDDSSVTQSNIRIRKISDEYLK